MNNRILTILLILAVVSFAQEQWEPTNGPYGGEIRSLAINSKGQLFAATSGGVFQSSDNGSSWTPADSVNMEMYSIIVRKDDKLIASTYYNIYASEDDGQTWSKLTDQYAVYKLVDAGDFIFGLFNGPGSIMRSPDGVNWTQLTLTGYLEDLAVNSQGEIFAVGGQSVYHSTNQGDSWNEDFHIEENVIVSVFINKNDDIFIGTFKGVYVSTDNGSTWTERTNGLDFLPEYERTVKCFAEDNSAGLIYAGTYHGIFRTSNKGGQWERVYNDSSDYLVNCLIYTIDNQIFAGTRGNAFIRSSDNGSTWTVLNKGISNTTVRSIAIDNDGLIYAGTIESGLFTSSDKGENWKQLLPAEWWQSVRAGANGYIYVLDGFGYLNVSTDKGSNWTSYDSLSFSELYVNSVSEIFAISRPGPDMLYKSTEDGKSWQKIKESSWMNDIAFDNNYIFLAANDTLFMSPDYGNTWESLDRQLITSIETDSKGKIFAVSYFGIRSSSDRGTSWEHLQDYQPAFIYINPLDHLFLKGFWNEGVFISTNGGTHFEYTGLKGFEVNCIAGDKNGYNYAGVSGRGVMRYFNNTPVVKVDESVNAELSFYLSPNYPNPFNPETTIKFGLQERAHVSLKVFDVLGKEIKTLVNEEKSSGNFEVKFNAANLASGIYYYQLRAGDFVEVRKMIVLR